MEELLLYGDENPELMMTFQCGDGNVRVLQVLMCARSKVISRMMDTDCVEAKTKTVKIVDFSAEIAKKIVEFVETGRIAIAKGYEQQLARMADKYEINSMREYAEILMISRLNYQNALEIYQFSCTHSYEKLKQSCIDFASKNIKKIFHTSAGVNIHANTLKEFFSDIHEELVEPSAKKSKQN